MADLHQHDAIADPAFAPHDHSHCAGNGLARAEVLAASRTVGPDGPVSWVI